MSLLFKRNIQGFKHQLNIANKRIELLDYKYLNRLDITYTNNTGDNQDYPYMESLDRVANLIPLPKLMLRPLLKHKLNYSPVDTIVEADLSKRTVIYFHGGGGYSEDNSLLHLEMLKDNCNLIRVDYNIDFEREAFDYPSVATDMSNFLQSIDSKVLPRMIEELHEVFTRLQETYGSLFDHKKVTVVGHSLGAGIAAEWINTTIVDIDSFINLDGTLFAHTINNGISVNQLHLSQDYNFDVSWLDQDIQDPVKALGKDYGLRIRDCINHSDTKTTWLQLNTANHVAFTDAPNLVHYNRLLHKYVGHQDTAKRIRHYVTEFIKSDAIEASGLDKMIKRS